MWQRFPMKFLLRYCLLFKPHPLHLPFLLSSMDCPLNPMKFLPYDKTLPAYLKVHFDVPVSYLDLLYLLLDEFLFFYAVRRCHGSILLPFHFRNCSKHHMLLLYLFAKLHCFVYFVLNFFNHGLIYYGFFYHKNLLYGDLLLPFYLFFFNFLNHILLDETAFT